MLRRPSLASFADLQDPARAGHRHRRHRDDRGRAGTAGARHELKSAHACREGSGGVPARRGASVTTAPTCAPAQAGARMPFRPDRLHPDRPLPRRRQKPDHPSPPSSLPLPVREAPPAQDRISPLRSPRAKSKDSPGPVEGGRCPVRNACPPEQPMVQGHGSLPGAWFERGPARNRPAPRADRGARAARAAHRHAGADRPLDSAPATRHSGAKIEGEPRSMFATSLSVTTCARMRAGALSPPFPPCRPA